MRVLVTGATGQLGRDFVRAALAAGHHVRALCRRERRDDSTVAWVKGDLVSGDGLSTACEGIDAIVHLASDPPNAAIADVEGTRRLLDAARAAGVRHFVYMSIAGIDRIPLEYYRHKLAVEKIVEQSGVPHTILRASQFHSLIDEKLRGFARLPFAIIIPAGFKVQSIATEDVAQELIAVLASPPQERAPDLAGPEPMTLAEAARIWRNVGKVRKVVLPVPVFGGLAAGFRAGYNTAPDRPSGTITWRAWLSREVS